MARTAKARRPKTTFQRIPQIEVADIDAIASVAPKSKMDAASIVKNLMDDAGTPVGRFTIQLPERMRTIFKTAPAWMGFCDAITAPATIVAGP